MAISGTRTIRVHAETTADGRGLLAFANDLDRTAREVDRLDHSLGNAGDGMRDFSRDAQSFNRVIAESKDRVRDLHLAIARTGGADKSLFGDLRREEQNLRRLERTALAIAGMRSGGGGGGGGWGGTGIDFSRGLGESRGILIAGLVGLAVLASPAIGAVIGGAVTGAVGAGGIIGGVVAAFTDPRVKDAGKRFAESFSADDFGREAFVRPTIAALAELKDAFRDMDVGSALEKMAPFVVTVAKGIGDLGRNFMPGFNETLEKAGPFMEVFAQGLGETGAALGDMISDMASSEGSIEGLVALFDVLSGTIRFVGAATRELADIWDFLTDVGQTTTDSIANVLDTMGKVPVIGAWWKHLGDMARNMEGHYRDMNHALEEGSSKADQARRRYQDLANASDEVAMAIASQRDALADLNTEYQNFFDISMSVDEANQRLNESWLRLRESLVENRGHWETDTKEGLANRAAVLGVVSALNQQREAALKAAGDSIEGQRAANRTYQDGIVELKQWAAAHGLVGAALKDLVGDYEVRVHFKALYDLALATLLRVAGKGLAALDFGAISKMGGGAGTAGGGAGGGGGSSPSYNWPGGVPPSSNPPSPWGGSPGYPGYASGGMAPANTPVVIGEHSPYGPMMTTFRRPTYIMPDAGMNGAQAGGTQRFEFEFTGGDTQVVAFMGEMLRRFCKVKAGGNVQAALGSTSR